MATKKITTSKYGTRLGRPPENPVSRFTKYVNAGEPNECWPWTGHFRKKEGYGKFTLDGVSMNAMRVSYLLFRGEIPAGSQIDHTCHTADASCLGGATCTHRKCVNPLHLEAVSLGENVIRGRRFNSQKTHCPSGHEYNEANTYITKKGYRICRVCAREGPACAAFKQSSARRFTQ